MCLSHKLKITGFSFLKRYIGMIIVFVLMMIYTQPVKAATETLSTGSFIINMGIVPQTVANGLKPYGMIYDLIKNYGVPIKWVIDTLKVKDGVDFTYGGIQYRGGPFIIPAEYRTTAVNARITYWQGLGVVGATTTSPLDVHVYKTLVVSSAPNWTLDKQNGLIAVPYFTNAGIPSNAYGGSTSSTWKNPADLTDCDDVFAMPHADPTWATHKNLLAWNRDFKGSLYTSCHSGSATELMFNPANPTEQSNYLSLKTGTAGGTGPYALPNNSLIAWGSHSNGSPPYSYNYASDPVMQFMGTIDAAILNGSEQIYIPIQTASAGWRPTTMIGVYDPTQINCTLPDEKYRAALLVYGYAFGDTNRGYVMYEVAHSLAGGTAPANIAAQRAFFNFSFLAGKQKAPDPQLSVNLSSVYSGTTNTLKFTLTTRPITDFTTILWESSCGGSFTPNNTQSVSYLAPTVTTPTPCTITITLTDLCGKVYKSTSAFNILTDYTIVSTITAACGTDANGAINMTITYASGPFVWNWTRTEGGSGSGTGTSITGLLPGNYTVTVVSNGGLGTTKTFSIGVNASPAMTVSTTPVNLTCNGAGNGSITVGVSGGTPPITYSWGDGPTTQNRNGLAAGTYGLTVTDALGCIKTASVPITQPNAIVITPTITTINCYGNNTGAISLAVTGGTAPYSYLWNDGNTSQNRTGLLAGTYSVTVTDANRCTQTLNSIQVTQPSAALTLSETHNQVSCNGSSSGSIDLAVSGGTSPYTYAWTGPGSYSATSQDISSLAAETYNVTVTDNKGCSASKSVTITQPAALSLSTAVTQPTCPADATVRNNDGAINLTVSGGTSPFSYAWTASNGGVVPTGQAAIEDLTTLVAGTYSVQVTDHNGCTKSASVTLKNLYPKPVTPGTITK